MPPSASNSSNTASNGASSAAKAQPKPQPQRQHGVQGVYYGGEWLDIEDCDGKFTGDLKNCSGCDFQEPCPRSQSRNSAAKKLSTNDVGTAAATYDVLIVGAGCIGASIARELSRYRDLSILLVEAADDVSQGATKGNSGIVHAGYDDKPGSVRAQHCWKGNQMFAQLDRELRFGYQKNGSLVVAFNDEDVKELNNLLQRGITNGVQNLRIVEQPELAEMEPYLDKTAVAALFSPDAGNVIPYEFAIALAENAVDNGVELRIRTAVTGIETDANDPELFTVTLQHWEPQAYLEAVQKDNASVLNHPVVRIVSTTLLFTLLYGLALQSGVLPHDAHGKVEPQYHGVLLVVLYALVTKVRASFLLDGGGSGKKISRNTPLKELVEQAGPPVGGGGHKVTVDDMLQGGSGSAHAMNGKIVDNSSKVRCRYVINCAGGAADQVARMIGDDSFKIKPRLGDYILLNRNQVRACV